MLKENREIKEKEMRCKTNNQIIKQSNRFLFVFIVLIHENRYNSRKDDKTSAGYLDLIT